jgi:phage terminase small subunit
MALTAKQARFVEEYLIDFNATQAAIRSGYSEKTARQIASQNLAKPDVSEAIRIAVDARSRRTGITQDRVLAELEGLAFARLEHFEVDAAGNVTAKADAPAHVMAAIQTIKRKEWSDGEGGHTVEVELKLHGKLEPLRLAGRHIDVKGFWDRLESDAPSDQPINLEIYGGLPPDEEDKPAIGSA